MRRRGTVWPWMRSSWSLSELDRLRPEGGATLGPFHPSRRPSGLAHLALSDGHFVDHPAQFTHVPSKGFAQFDFTILADQNPIEAFGVQGLAQGGFGFWVGIDHNHDVAFLQRSYVRLQKRHLLGESGIQRAIGKHNPGPRRPNDIREINLFGVENMGRIGAPNVQGLPGQDGRGDGQKPEP